VYSFTLVLGKLFVRKDMAAVGENVPVSSHTAEKATRAKMTLENYYLNLVAQHEERDHRYKQLEKTMEEEGLSEEQVSINA
jgi:serine/threonine kinase 38